MVKIISEPTLNVKVSFTIDEGECRALDALAGYGADTFIKAFYEVLGKSYMEPHAASMKNFLEEIRKVIGPALNKIDKARQLLKNDK